MVPGGLIGPEVPHDAVRWEYHCSFYDRPLSGAVVFSGERLWAKFVDAVWEQTGTDEDGEPDRRRTDFFQLYRLTPEVWAAEAERNADWERWVGTHCRHEYDADGVRRRAGVYTPTGEADKYRVKYDGSYPVDLAGGKTVGEPVAWYRD